MYKLIKAYWVILIACMMSKSYAFDNYPVIIESGTNEVLAMVEQNALQQDINKQPLGKVIEWSALQLLGSVYVGRLLDEKTPEYLYISLTATDCMLFVEEVVALGELIKQDKLNLDSLTQNIKRLRYHGDVKYCNRNHYSKDWALSNIKQGLVVDVGYSLTKQIFPYKAQILSDNIKNNASSPHASDLTCIEQHEQMINDERLGFVSLKELPRYLKYIKSGDIIGIVRTPNKHADAVHHLGIAYVHAGKVGMINASSDVGEVVVADSLLGYLRKFKDSQGIILLRAVN